MMMMMLEMAEFKEFGPVKLCLVLRSYEFSIEAIEHFQAGDDDWSLEEG